MRIVTLFIILLLGCTPKDKYPILDMEPGPDFYITLLGDVNNKLDESDSDEKPGLLYKKLFISQQLRWPEDVSEDIRYLMRHEGLDYELYQYAADFYEFSHYYERLLDIVNKWTGQHQPSSADSKFRIIALKGLNREQEANHLLWNFLQRKDQKEDLKFIAKQYLDFKDTARALYAYSRLARFHPREEELRHTYVPLLIEAGYPIRARDLLLQQSEHTKDEKTQLLMARILYDLGEPYEAIEMVRKLDDPTHYLQLARWFQSLNAWDSAIYYTDLLIAKDSSRQALLTKGSIYEQRGWLNSAYQTFSSLIRQDSSDSIAINRAEIVARKIAYLRRRQETERKIPTLNIQKKKSTENE